jgi:threonine/homoserine/homoserine lactone efflux protein
MIDTHVLTFTIAAIFITLLPGADTMLVIRSVLTRGQTAGLITTIGICCGLFFHATLSALGLSVILVHSAMVFQVVKYAGACYLVFLGIQTIRHSLRHHRKDMAVVTVQHGWPAGAPAPERNRWKQSLLEGWLSNVLNPKVAIFYLAFLPQFITPTDPVLAKSLLLAGIHFVLGIVWLCTMVLFLGRVGTYIASSGIRQKIELATGAILIALGVRLALEQR